MLVSDSLPCIVLLQTYAEACEWVELLQQMFHETALPYIALIANKLDDFSLLQAASDQLHRITADIPQAYRCA